MPANNKKNRRIIITGGNGFIGQNLVWRILAGKYFDELIILDRNGTAPDGVRVAVGDFSDEALLRTVIREGDTVVHLACTTIPATSESNPEKDETENVLGTKKLLNVCREKKIASFVFMSSGGTVYGDHGNKKIKENAAASPLNRHGRMKLDIEKMVQQYSAKHGFSYLIIRGANPYGRTGNMEKPQGAIDAFLRKAIKEEKIDIWGDGNIIRDFIHIDDFSELVCLAVEKGLENEILNVGSGRGHSLNDVISTMEKALGRKVEVERLDNRNFDVSSNILDVDKARRLLDWNPKYDLEEGIRDVVKRILGH